MRARKAERQAVRLTARREAWTKRKAAVGRRSSESGWNKAPGSQNHHKQG